MFLIIFDYIFLLYIYIEGGSTAFIRYFVCIWPWGIINLILCNQTLKEQNAERVEVEEGRVGRNIDTTESNSLVATCRQIKTSLIKCLLSFEDNAAKKKTQ